MGRKSLGQKHKEEERKKYIAWQKQHTRLFGIRFSVEKEQEYIDWLNSMESPKNYIKELIREDMERNGKVPKEDNKDNDKKENPPEPTPAKEEPKKFWLN